MSLNKPTIDKAINFAEQNPTESKPKGNQVPVGDVRLTANISKVHHHKVKLAALRKNTTIGELLERLIDTL